MADNNEKLIWDTLMKEIGNPYGVAGLMGNLFAESSLNPLCKTGGSKDIKNMRPADYVYIIDHNQYPIGTFSHDGCAFGIVQWRFWSRKENLYHIWQTKKERTSIGDLSFQLDFLLFEIKTYKTVWNTLKNATSVKEASDIVLIRYEQPASVSDKTKEKRAQFGQGYFDKYASGDVKPDPEPAPIEPVGPERVRTTKEKVNIRRGNNRQYGVIVQVPKAGTCFPYVTKVGDWYAVEVKTGKLKQVGWISSEFAEIV